MTRVRPDFRQGRRSIYRDPTMRAENLGTAENEKESRMTMPDVTADLERPPSGSRI